MQNPESPKNPQHSVDPENEKRMRDHLSNPNDEITEDDIKNVKTDFDGHEPEENLSEDEKKVLKKKIEDDLDTSIDTSWNVLGT